jgi:NAD(P)-dependent dehydrogenase (short-subunit alcohol dehydrogenase family)
MSKPEQIEAMVSRAQALFGGIDVLCAGQRMNQEG